MFSSLFKKKKDSSLDWLHTDIHSHLLPGIDDGAPDMDTSLELIRGLAAMGVKKIITTPHVLWEMYPNTYETIVQKAGEVQQALTTENIDIEFKAAAEYYLDEHFVNDLQLKKPLLTIRDKLVLVEFSMITAPFDLKDILFELQMQGYEVLIAHPERYIYLRGNKEFYQELRELGCEFQLNLLSVAGYYGRSVQDLAEYLFRQGLYSYAGTDLHNEKHLQALQKAVSIHAFDKLEGSAIFKNDQL